MTSVTIVVGIVLLAIALVARHAGDAVVTIAASWIGCILVVVGLGKLIFLD